MIDNILSQIDDVSEELKTRAAEMERTRRMPLDLAQTLAGTGAFSLLTPKSLGGPELSPENFVLALARIAEANAAAGWCAMIASTNAITAAYLPADIAQNIFGNPDVITGGVFAPIGKAVLDGDHYKVSGRWAWGSGSANCSWLAGGCTIWEDGEMRRHADGTPETRMMLFPNSDVILHDNWHVMGLKGTGSGDFEVKDCLVPKSRSVSLQTDQPREKGALYKFPVFGLLSLGICAVALGNSRAAIDSATEFARTKKLMGGKNFSDKASAQVKIAEIEASWRAAHSYIMAESRRVWDIAQSSVTVNNAEIPVEARADLRLASTHGVRVSAAICQSAYNLGGGAALFENHDLQRQFRDAHAMTQHIMTAAPTYELIGRIMLGRSVNTSMV